MAMRKTHENEAVFYEDYAKHPQIYALGRKTQFQCGFSQFLESNKAEEKHF